MGTRRAQALGRNPRAEVALVYDPDRSRADAVARDVGCEVAAAPDRFLHGPDLDAVIVSTPNACHAELMLENLARGRHMFCEKPLATSSEVARRIARAAAERALRVQVGSNLRHFGCVKEARRLIVSGALGPINFARGWIGHDGWSLTTIPWTRDLRQTGGGTLLDNGCHLIDLSRWMFGGIASVVGYGATRQHVLEPGQEDNFFGILTTTTGVPISLQSSWTEWHGYLYFEVYGREGAVRIDGRAPESRTTLSLRGQAPEVFDFASEGPVSFQGEIDQFIAAVADGTAPSPDAEDGAEVVRICEALYESSRDGSGFRRV